MSNAGSNYPCPCGSGLKWKRCCRDKPWRDTVATQAEKSEAVRAALQEWVNLTDEERERRQVEFCPRTGCTLSMLWALVEPAHAPERTMPL